MTRTPFLPLVRIEDGEPSSLRTEVALAADSRRLVALFRCEFVRLAPSGAAHDDDLWEGDVVELFLAPDPEDRRVYYELEVNPAGLVFDARVDSPGLDRRTMRVDRGWNPGGLRTRSRILPPLAGIPGPRPDAPSRTSADTPSRPCRPARIGAGEDPIASEGEGRKQAGESAMPSEAGHGLWLVRIALDWAELLPSGCRPGTIAFGAYRIDRLSTGAPQFLSLFPNFRSPADFHAPREFGILDAARGVIRPAP